MPRRSTAFVQSGKKTYRTMLPLFCINVQTNAEGVVQCGVCSLLSPLPLPRCLVHKSKVGRGTWHNKWLDQWLNFQRRPLSTDVSQKNTCRLGQRVTRCRKVNCINVTATNIFISYRAVFTLKKKKQYYWSNNRRIDNAVALVPSAFYCGFSTRGLKAQFYYTNNLF